LLFKGDLLSRSKELPSPKKVCIRLVRQCCDERHEKGWRARGLFLILFLILFVVWILSWLVFHVASFLIHILLVLAIICLIIHLVRPRHTVA